MSRLKVAITLDEETLHEIDHLVEQKVFPNRSQAIQEAVGEKLDRLSQGRLMQEIANFDPDLEEKLAEEDLSKDRPRPHLILHRRGKNIAALVSMEELEFLEKMIEETEDQIDIEESHKIKKQIEREGTVPWEHVKRELGL